MYIVRDGKLSIVLFESGTQCEGSNVCMLR